MVEVTLLGGLWLAVLAVLFFMPLRYTAGFMLFSSAFQAAAVVNAGGKGIMPLLVAEMAFILRWLAGAPRLQRTGQLGFTKKVAWAALFIGFACTASLLLPLAFGGIFLLGAVYGGVAYPGAPLYGDMVALGADQLLKIISLLLHGSALVLLLCTRGLFTRRQLKGWVKLTVAVTVLVGLWETTAKNGLPPSFPEDFFHNNAGYTLKGLSGQRTNFTFAEPSYAGGFYAALLVGWMAADARREWGILPLLLAAFTLSLAGTSVVTLAAGLVLLALLPGRAGRGRALGALCLLGLLLLASGYGALYYDLVAGKMVSFSGQERLAGILYGWQVFRRSFGLGVGMGTVRTFSFATELLSSLGIVGLGLYVGLLFALLRPLYRIQKQDATARFALVFALCHLAAQCAALPDLTTPTLWMSLFLAACAGNLREETPAASFAPLLPAWLQGATAERRDAL